MQLIALLALTLIAWRQDAPRPATHPRPFYVELREENWYENGQRSERISCITRLPDKSFFALHPFSGPHVPSWRKSHAYFYLVNWTERVCYIGDTLTRASTPQYVNDLSQIFDPYDDCSVLEDSSIQKGEAAPILAFRVFRTDTTEKHERHLKWQAPDLGCFPLRSQVLVDDVVRERVEALKVTLLLEDTKLALPQGIRIVPPKEYCELYQAKHRGEQVFPPKVCDKLQRSYEQRKSPTQK